MDASAASPVKFTRRNLLRSITTLFSGSAVAQGMTALALLLTARQLGADSYGQYAAGLAFAGLAAIIFNLGLDLWLLQAGGRDPARLPELAGSVLAIKLIVGALWFLILVLITPLLNQDTYPQAVLRWSAFLIWSDNLLTTILTSFKATLRNTIPAALEAAADIIWVSVTLVFIAAGAKQVLVYLQARFLISVLALGVAVLLAARLLGLKLAPTFIRRAVIEVWPFALSEFLALLALRMDVVVVSSTLGKQAVGLYSPAVGLVNMLFLVPFAVYTVMVPVLSNLYMNNRPQAQLTASRTIRLLLTVGVLLTGLFALSAPLVVWILGPSYQPLAELIRILSLVLFFKCGSFAMAAILVASGMQARRPLVQAAAVLINLGLNLVAVYTIGIRGVAAAYVISEIVIFAGYSWIVWRSR